MSKHLPHALLAPTQLSRRRFVRGLAAGGVLAGLSAVTWAGVSGSASSQSVKPTELSGTAIDLVIAETPVNFTGTTRTAITINGLLPGPTLRLREGDTVTIRVTNKLKESTSIHWHGIILPFQMDGVPGISFPGIAPGETFTYRFTLEQSGTYWYHSHSGMQELMGMYGALIIEPREADIIRADRDHVMLTDWIDSDPMRAFEKLKAQGDIYNLNRATAGDFLRDASKSGMSEAINKRKMWNQMRMSSSDLADLSSSVLTYLTNGTTPEGNWTGLFNPGVQTDGVNIEPVTVDEFRFGPGQTYDVLVQPKDDAYTVFAQTMDRTGYARGTLATRRGLLAPVPDLDALQLLTMADMYGSLQDEWHEYHVYANDRHEPRWYGNGPQSAYCCIWQPISKTQPDCTTRKNRIRCEHRHAC